MACKIAMYLTMWFSKAWFSTSFGWLLSILCDTTHKCPHVKEAISQTKFRCSKPSAQKHTSTTAVLSKLMAIHCAEYCPTSIGQLPSPVGLVATIKEENELSQSWGSGDDSEPCPLARNTTSSWPAQDPLEWRTLMSSGYWDTAGMKEAVWK